MEDKKRKYVKMKITRHEKNGNIKTPETTERRQTIEPQILRTQRRGQQWHFSVCLSYTCGHGAGTLSDRHGYGVQCAVCTVCAVCNV
jgi:hypothetical protein